MPTFTFLQTSNQSQFTCFGISYKDRPKYDRCYLTHVVEIHTSMPEKLFVFHIENLTKNLILICTVRVIKDNNVIVFNNACYMFRSIRSS